MSVFWDVPYIYRSNLIPLGFPVGLTFVPRFLLPQESTTGVESKVFASIHWLRLRQKNPQKVVIQWNKIPSFSGTNIQENPTLASSENHLQKWFLMGYVSSQDGIPPMVVKNGDLLG